MICIKAKFTQKFMGFSYFLKNDKEIQRILLKYVLNSKIIDEYIFCLVFSFYFMKSVFKMNILNYKKGN